MGSAPAITVLMPVYNGARYLPESARGVYLARMDCDDISRPGRLKKQYDFMEAHPEVGVCDTWIDCFGDLKARWRYPLDHQEIVCRMLFTSPVGHATTMFRRQVLVDQNVFYAENFPCAEDYELWARLYLLTRFANLGEALYQYRRYPAQTMMQHRVISDESARAVQRRLFEEMGVHPTDEELRLHAGAVRGELAAADGSLERLDAWFEQIIRGNQQQGQHPEALLKRDLLHYWWKACWFMSDHAKTWSAFGDSDIYRNARWQERWLKSGLLAVKNLASTVGRAGEFLR